jgi:glycosyltransferase involved in cell wall biosynthesis
MPENVRKKRVLIAITKSNFGGAQRYVYDLARSLSRDSYEVAVLCGGGGVLVDKLHAEHIRTIPLQSLQRDVRLVSDVVAFFVLLRTLFRERPDLLHLNSSKMGIMGVVAGRLAFVPRIVFTAHGWAFNESRSFLSRNIIYLLALCTVALAHKTIAVSEAVAKDIPMFRRNIVVVHNGVETPTLMERAHARALLISDVRDPNDVWVGTIAELHHTKGLIFALRAFKQYATIHTSARFVVLGEGDERKTLEREIETLGLKDVVHLVGFKDNAATYLKAFDVFVLSSLSEGLSYVLLEAGAANVPVIATRVGGIPELIEHDISGLLVPPRDAEALADSLQKLTRDTGLQHKLTATFHEKVVTRFSLAEMVRQTTVVYER